METGDDRTTYSESPRDLLERLRAELVPGDGTVRGIGLGFGHVSVRFSALGPENAERLHRLYGDRVDLRVGSRSYPRAGTTSELRIPVRGEPDPRLSVTLSTEVARIASGRTTIGVASIRNVSSDSIEIRDAGWFGGVTLPGSEILAGSYSGAMTGVGHSWHVEPEGSVKVRGVIGTESCLPDGSYLLKPGTYDAVAAVTVVPFEPGCDVPSQPRWTYVARTPIEIV